MSTPRVLMVPQFFRPVVGGAERQAEKLSRALLERGVHVEILTPRHDDGWPEHEERDGLRVHRFPLHDLSRDTRLAGVSLVNAWYMGAQIRRTLDRFLPRFDIVHTHIASPFSSLVAHAASRRGKRVICKIAIGGEELFDLTVLRRDSLAGPLHLRRLFAAVDRWIAISSQIRQEILAAGVDPGSVSLIPNGVDLLPTRPRPAGGRARRFLYLGRFPRFRDFRSLLLGFEGLLAEEPECELRLVGGGDLEEELRRTIADLPRAGRRAAVVGFSDPAEWLAWADVLVQPSHAEGLSNSLLEGMSAGLACVASDIPPNRELLDDGRAGLLVPLQDPDAMRDALLRLAAEPDLAAELGDRARRRVEEVFSIGSVADRYAELYRALLGNR